MVPSWHPYGLSEAELEEDRRQNPESWVDSVDDFRQPHYELHNTVFLGDNLSLTNRFYYIEGEGYYENYREDASAAAYALNFKPGVAPDDELDLIRRKWVRKHHGGWVPGLEWNQNRGRLLVGGDFHTYLQSGRSAVITQAAGTEARIKGGFYLGYGGNGTWTQIGGTNAVTGVFRIGDAGGTAVYNLNGGLLSVAGSPCYLSVGAGASTVNQSGGTAIFAVARDTTGSHALLDAGHRPCPHQLRPAHAPGLTDASEVVALEM